MAKKKKAVKAKKNKKVIKAKVKKSAKKKAVKKQIRAKAQAKAKVIKEKVLGKIDHFFDKISVAAIKVTAPFKVGDIIHIKGHTTDFVQRVDSMQIEHQGIEKAKKGDDVGMKVKDFVRQNDKVYLSDEKALLAKPVKVASASKPLVVQQAMFPGVKPVVKTQSALPVNQPKPAMPEVKKPAGYSEKKFFSF